MLSVLHPIHRPATTAVPTVNGTGRLTFMTIPFASCSLLAAASGADPRINEDEWGAFLHLPNDQFYGLNMIRSEIVRDTEAKNGRNAGISPQPINWRIVSPDVLTLTLVDLPGLTKVPVRD